MLRTTRPRSTLLSRVHYTSPPHDVPQHLVRLNIHTLIGQFDDRLGCTWLGMFSFFFSKTTDTINVSYRILSPFPCSVPQILSLLYHITRTSSSINKKYFQVHANSFFNTVRTFTSTYRFLHNVHFSIGRFTILRGIFVPLLTKITINVNESINAQRNKSIAN